MSADTILQDSLNRRKQEYSGKLMLMARKRELARRDIEDIDREVDRLEAALREVQRAEGDWQAQQTAVAAEAKAQENPSDDPDEPIPPAGRMIREGKKPGTQVNPKRKKKGA